MPTGFHRKYWIIAGLFLLAILCMLLGRGPSLSPAVAVSTEPGSGTQTKRPQPTERESRDHRMREARRSTLSPSRRVGLDSLDDAGVPHDKRKSVQHAFDITFDEVEEQMARKLEKKDVLPGAPEGVETFEYKGDQTIHQNAMRDLARRLDELVGAEASRVLLETFQEGRFYGGMGKYDLTFQLTTGPEMGGRYGRQSGDSGTTFKVVTRDPRSQKPVGSFSSNEESFVEAYGTLIPLPR